MEKISSADGTEIAFETSGSGPAVILVAGALTDRVGLRPLAEFLSRDLTVINFDRRGRGDTRDARAGVPDSVHPEIEDIAALATTVRGPVSIYGHSSGAALAVRAAAELGPAKLVLHEPPFDPDDADESQSDPADYSRQLRQILELGDEEGAVELFLLTVGMPAEMVNRIKSSPEWAGWVAKGRSLAYDSVAVGDGSGGRIPRDLLPEVTCPTLTLAGSETFPFMISVAETLAEELPNALCMVIAGADHESGPDLIGPPVSAFLAD